MRAEITFILTAAVCACAGAAFAGDSHRDPGPAHAGGPPPTAHSNVPAGAVAYAKPSKPPTYTAGPTRVVPGAANAINSQPVPPGHGAPTGWDTSRSSHK